MSSFDPSGSLGSPYDEQPTTPGPKRAASLSPGTVRAQGDRMAVADDTPLATSGLENPAFMGDLSDCESSSPPSPSLSPSAGKAKAKVDIFLYKKSSLKRSKTSDQGSASQGHGSTSSRVSFRLTPKEPQRRIVQADIEGEDRTPSPEVEEDDSKDKDYEEPPIRRPKSVAGSPKKRKEGSISTSAKKHVRDADPHNGVCLLTNAPHPSCSRQFCHGIPRSIPDLILTALEWWWQMLYWTLYIDTRYNMFPLMATWHIAMDANRWTLCVPISESYHGQTEFTYYFMALSKDMKEVAIHRYNEDYDPTNVETHLYPFSTIGPLTSHIHPHFIIFSAGEKLTKLGAGKSADESDALLQGFAEVVSFGHEGTPDEVVAANLSSLEDIVEIYEQWSVTEGIPHKEDNPRHPWMHHDDEFKEELQQEKV